MRDYVKGFYKWLEAYYGNYPPVVGKEVVSWLEDKPDHMIRALKDVVRDKISRQYNNIPDVAQLNKVLPEAIRQSYRYHEVKMIEEEGLRDYTEQIKELVDDLMKARKETKKTLRKQEKNHGK